MLPDAKILYENSMFENLKFVSRTNSNENHLFWLFRCGNMKMIHSQKIARHKEINNIASSAYFSVSTKQSTLICHSLVWLHLCLRSHYSGNAGITTKHMETYTNFNKNRKHWKMVYIQVNWALENQLRLCFQAWSILQKNKTFIVFRDYFE